MSGEAPVVVCARTLNLPIDQRTTLGNDPRGSAGPDACIS
jgi:hypothetical protein